MHGQKDSESEQVSTSNSSFGSHINGVSECGTNLLLVNHALDDGEIDLTEEELRGIYDTEEMNRFIGLFSAFVTEVELQEEDSKKNDVQASSVSRPLAIDDDWTSTAPPHAPSIPTPPKYTSLSEAIAYQYLIPILPPSLPEAPPFTIGRLRLTLQRLYLATVPTYGPFFQNLLGLATWRNPSISLLYCALYWILWWQNLLCTGLVLRVFYSLIKRRIFPYPNLDDLRRHREEVLRADEFSQQVSERLSASSSGITELYRLFRLYCMTKNKYKEKAAKTMNNIATNWDGYDTENHCMKQDPTVLDIVDDNETTNDMKRVALEILANIAEFHERVRNVFSWRRPSSSRRYATWLFFTFLITLLPAQYISKALLFILGVIFWHVIPVVASLPSSERNRVFILLSDVPTDGEYAMELVSQRIAEGLPINPPKPSKSPKRQRPINSISTLDPQNVGASRSGGYSMNWKKMGNAVAVGKSIINDMKSLTPNKALTFHEKRSQPRTPDTLNYPCQHSSGPGLITLTQTNFLFTSLMSQTPKIVISLSAVKGLKKAGILKGLHIRWYNPLDGTDAAKELKEDKFTWIGGRDELFARLVSSEGKRWITI